MDEKFRSSFIPKQPLVGQEGTSTRRSQRRHSPSGPLLPIAVALLILSAFSYGGVFGYNYLVRKDIVEMKSKLEEQKQQFRPAEIAEYKRFDDRLRVAKRVLGNHVALSEIFTLLNNATLPTIQFTDFTFSKEAVPATETEVDGQVVTTPASENLTLGLVGVGPTLDDIALQSREFKQSEFIKNTRFSGFKLNTDGTYAFNADLKIDSKLINYLAALGRAPALTIEELPNSNNSDEGVSTDSGGDEDGFTVGGSDGETTDETF